MSVKRYVLSACALLTLPIATAWAENNTTNLVDGYTSNFPSGYALGRTGTNNWLIITNAGQLYVAGDGIIGSNSTAHANMARVTGANSLWSNSGTLYVGYSGSSNQLAIESGGAVSASNVWVGSDPTSTGNLVSISGGNLYATNAVGNGTLEVRRGTILLSGGTVTADQIVLTNGAASVIVFNGGTLNSGGSRVSNGVAFIVGDTGNGATFNALGGQHGFSNGLTVGHSGYGNFFNITNAAQVQVSGGNSAIGNTTGASNNAVLVNGTGSAWKNSGELYVGYSGSSNQLTIQSGGVVSNTYGYIGYNAASSNNAATVTGPGSVWNNSGDLYIGLYGSRNSLTIANSGKVANTWGYIGYGASSNNTATVTGPGSVWSNSGALSVGIYGSNNSLTIANSGKVFASAGVIGYETSARNNAATVTGPGSVWSNSGNLYVGSYGSGNSLTITNGGQVFNTLGYIGHRVNAGNNNAATVTGPGSVWSNSGDLYVGREGSGNRLTIANSGQVFNVNGFIAYNTGARNNAATVTGPGSVWSNSVDLYVGIWGYSNSLTITNGGQVFNTHSYIGFGASADNNAATVTSPGSVWSNSGNLYVGRDGPSSSLTIANSGQVFNTIGYIGEYSSSSNNTVLVTGAGSVWSNSGTLYVGEYGSGNSLTIADGGTVAATNVVIGYYATTGNGITVTGGHLYATNATGGGAFEVRRGTLALNGGTIRTDQLLATNGAASVVSFGGGMVQAKGALVNNGGAFTVGDGAQPATYAMLGGNHVFSNGLTVASQGALIGTGYANQVTVQPGGTVAPGFSPGTQFFTTLALSNNAIVQSEIAASNLYDRIVATNLTVGGVVQWNLSLIGDFIPSNTVFTLFDVGAYVSSATNNWLSFDGNLLTEGEIFNLTTTNGALEAFRISYTGVDGNNVILTALPEPGSALLLVLIGAALYVRRRIHSKTGRWRR